MTKAAAKELRSLTSSFALIRVLQRVANGRLEPLRATDSTPDVSLNGTLLRLRRQGLIKSKGSQHSLTPAARKALKLAGSGLKQLATLNRRQA